MTENKSNAPIIAIVVVVALALLAVPCVLGALFVGGFAMWRSALTSEAMQATSEPEVATTTDFNPKITKESIESIREGMTLGEVESTLGRGLDKAPEDFQITATFDVEPEFYRWWWNGERGIVLGFRDGKVVGIGGKGPIESVPN